MTWEEEEKCDGDENKEIEIPHQREENEIEIPTTEEITKEESLFSNLKDDEDTFTTYSIYILRQDETIQTILEKYKIPKEVLEEYNDLSNIIEGSKIIIPTSDK